MLPNLIYIFIYITVYINIYTNRNNQYKYNFTYRDEILYALLNLKINLFL